MTENLLSSLDVTIARSRAQTIASHALAGRQQQDRFDAYDAFTAALKAKVGALNKKQPQHPGGRAGPGGPAGLEQAPGPFGASVIPSQTVHDATSPTHTRNSRSQGRNPAPPVVGHEASQEGGSAGDTGASEDQNGGAGSARVRT